jgi:hypothetical protein
MTAGRGARDVVDDLARAAQWARHTEDRPMVTCPLCGAKIDAHDIAELSLDDDLECPRCRRGWTVAVLEPLQLQSSEQELAFTD